MIGTAGLGWAVGGALGVRDLSGSAAFQLLATVLLAIGLYGSTCGIRIETARGNVGAIVFATTIGVLLKASLIMAAMYVLVDHEYAVLGLVVAQIDPLAVAAMTRRSGMSDEARTILRAWSSFDDPVTALLTVYVSAWLIHRDHGTGSSGDDALLSYAGGLAANLVFVLAAFALWRVLRSADRWASLRSPTDGDPTGPDSAGRRVVRIVTLVVLVCLFGVAVHGVLMLGLALTGLFYRPDLDAVTARATRAALIVATFALGLLLTGGLSPGPGAVLAIFAFAAQLLAGAIVPARLTGRDRVYLALGQQNGITAIILALALEPALPGTVAIVAPAILLINLIHLGANAWWDLPRRSAAHEDNADPGSKDYEGAW